MAMDAPGRDGIWVGRRELFVGALAASGAALGAFAGFAPGVAAAATTGAPVDPSAARAEAIKGIEAWTSSLAVQAATYAAPIVAMYLLRDSTCFKPGAKVKPNEIWRIENIATPEIAAQSGYVTPNVDVVYGFGFMDLAEEPIVLTAPDSRGRYYMIEICDMWTNAFAYPAGGASGYRGGTFALIGPGWRGELPPGVTRIDCPTRWIELQPRVFVKDQDDLAGAEATLGTIRVTGLAAFRGDAPRASADYRYESPRIAPGVASSQMLFDDPLQFWSIFSATMNENPPPQSEIDSVLPAFKYLGIEFGRAWRPESVNPLILNVMKQTAARIASLVSANAPQVGRLANGWLLLPANVGRAGADYLSRAAVAILGLTANIAEQAVYYSGVLDANGAPLNGEKRYVINFVEPMSYLKPVAPGFWSLTMYDAVTRFTAPNPINRYSLGGSDDFKRNADGSFTFFIQRDDPGADKRSNWLPCPAGQFYVVLRNYAPAPEVVAGLRNLATFEGPPGLTPVG
jgi:DNA sulfur modification protein DndE